MRLAGPAAPHAASLARLKIAAGAALGVSLAAAPPSARGQTAASPVGGHAAGHVVACVDVPPGATRPDLGCFNLGHVTGLTFGDSLVTWYLFRFPTWAAAESARSPHGFVAEEAGAVWLSELAAAGAPAPAAAGGTLSARVGPLTLPRAADYTATYAYAVMAPGDRSRVHVHPGPEAFYVIAGEQCLETAADDVVRTRAGGTAAAPAGVPMELTATGRGERRAFALVLHDGRLPQAAPDAWRPAGRCRPEPGR